MRMLSVTILHSTKMVNTKTDVGIYCLHIKSCRIFHAWHSTQLSLVGSEFNGPVNTIEVMSSGSVYLTTLFLGRLCPLSDLPVLVHILSPEINNCPLWISGKESMTAENISWSISMKKCSQTQQGSNPWPPHYQMDMHLTEPLRSAYNWLIKVQVKQTGKLFSDKLFFSDYIFKYCWNVNWSFSWMRKIILTLYNHFLLLNLV